MMKLNIFYFPDRGFLSLVQWLGATRFTNTTALAIMNQHTGVGNVVGVFDLDFEVINQFGRARGLMLVMTAVLLWVEIQVLT